jgi:hypothetical protein
MKRDEILKKAEQLTTADRNKQYGEPLENHQRIAKIWSVILGAEVSASAVALCMAGVKLARLSHDYADDSFVDGCAYFAIAGEIAETEKVISTE